jgi:hypothetical protein
MLSVDKSFELQPGQCFPQDDFNEFEEEREEKPLFHSPERNVINSIKIEKEEIPYPQEKNFRRGKVE